MGAPEISNMDRYERHRCQVGGSGGNTVRDTAANESRRGGSGGGYRQSLEIGDTYAHTSFDLTVSRADP
jgi:hypothetical protein